MLIQRDNPFKKYLEFLKELEELNQDEEVFYKGIGREFISLLENTSMSKVYKMPVLMAFYNHGNVLMEVSEEQLLSKLEGSSFQPEPTGKISIKI